MSAMVDEKKNPVNPSGEQISLTRNERVAIVVFFIVALAFAGWQYFAKGTVEVDVEGAVKSPGNVYLSPGATLGDAVEAAGGLAEGANSEALNFNDPVESGQRIVIPYGSSPYDPQASQQSRSRGYQPVTDDDPFPDNSNNTISDVNINTAGIDELSRLPGIGEGLAQRIIDYRREHGAFQRIDHIKNVNGIGDTRYDEIRHMITVDSP